MSGVSMMRFVYVSDVYRQAWRTYVKNSFDQWEDWPEDFKEELKYKLEEEQHWLRQCSRPSTWFLNDQLGENEFVFNMSQKHGHGNKYEYTENLPRFTDILMNKAEKIADLDRPIDILYSGGIDSTAVLLALYAVCPKDQLNIIMGGGKSAIENYPWMWENIIQNLNHTFTDNLKGAADPSTRVFTTGSEADRLFGADGYTMVMKDAHRDPDSKYGYTLKKGTKPTTDEEENWQWNQDRWWLLTRHTYLTQSFRFLENIACEKMDMENYQPMFFDKQVQQFAINLHIEKQHKWYNSGDLADNERYKKGKMWIRDFVYEMNGDREYAYEMGKTMMSPNVQWQYNFPLPPNLNVLAITEDGTVVNRHNIMNYMKREALTI